MNKEMIDNLSALVGRALIAIMFILSGYEKIGGYEGTLGYMEAFGVPAFLLPAVIAVELLGGIAILVGYQTRIAAFLLGGFTFLTAIIFHTDFSQDWQMIIFMKNLAITGGFMLLFVHGPGRWAVKSNH
ncbi:MAG: DoxX family protein [Gammaproteobacteria bacterium]